MDYADYVVHSAAVHREAAVLGGDKDCDKFVPGGGNGYGVHVQPRHHNIQHVPVVHSADGAHHINVVVIQLQDLGRGQGRRFRVGIAVVAGKFSGEAVVRAAAVVRGRFAPR